MKRHMMTTLETKWTRLRLFGVALTLMALLAVLACVACADDRPPARGVITTSDGVVLAESQNVSNGKGQRVYPQSAVTSPLVGSVITQDAAAGIEQVYETELLGGKDVQLTLDMSAQQAAFEALGAYSGTVVVLDVKTGGVLAMASTPSYDPSAAKADALAVVNRATELYIPGSTFKTITLTAALEKGIVTLDTRFSAPSVLVFDGGSVTNYSNMQYSDQTVQQAYAKSINTVFAQIALQVGVASIVEQAHAFGFETQILPDFPVKPSTIYGTDDMSALMRAWTGVGQALFQIDGSFQGPVMTAVQGVGIAATIANGGTVVPLHLVESVGGEPAEADEASANAPAAQAISAETAARISECMEFVVSEGTGRSAAVKGLDVRGKTGTAETASGADNGWFIGFTPIEDRTYAICVLVEGAESSEASRVAAEVFGSLRGIA